VLAARVDCEGMQEYQNGGTEGKTEDVLGEIETKMKEVGGGG
jgi:hypothetical protein